MESEIHRGDLTRKKIGIPMYAVRKELADQFSGKKTVKPLIRHSSVNMNMAMYAP